VAGVMPIAPSRMHFHDTYGQALANLYAGMEEGARVIDFRGRRSRRLPLTRRVRPATSRPEDVVYMLEGMALRPGVDMAKLWRLRTRSAA